MSKQTDLINIPDAITVSGSNVGINTSSPDTALNIGFSGADQVNSLRIEGSNGSSEKYLLDIEADGENAKTNFKIGVGGGAPTTRMTIDGSGRLLVGMTSSSSTTSGFRVIPNDFMSFTTTSSDAGDRALLLNRQSSDGTLLEFKKANSAVGSIGVVSSDMYLGTTDTGLRFLDSSNTIIPARGDTGATRDNSISFGTPSARYDNIYATNGTIQTSDFNEKQDIASLTATEMLVGKRISALFKTFRWKDSVAEKGDNARTHTGVIAQDVQAAFTAEGLDAGDYALFISSTW